MKNKRIVVIVSILVIMVALLTVFFVNITKDSKNTKLNVDSIKKSYALLTDSVNKYNETREKFNTLTTGLVLDNYKEKHDEFIELLTNYNKIINNIDNYVANIKAKCALVSSTSEVSNICASYDTTYEKLVNLYVNDINKYNEIITKYNEFKKEELALFEAVYEDYIDYNNDNVYEGRDSSAEN